MKDQTFSWQYHNICCQKRSRQQISEYSFVINSVEASKGSKITQLFPITSNYILHKGTSFLRNSKSWCLKTDKLYSRLKENTGLLRTLKKNKKTCNSRNESLSTKWPYWFESWEALSAHHMSLIVVNLYLCARVLVGFLCVLRAAVFAWADIRPSACSGKLCCGE